MSSSVCSNPFGKFTRLQLINMWLYIAGIVCYKFVLETLNTCIFNLMVRNDPTNPNSALLWTVLQSINYAMQCIGSLAVAPMIRRLKTNHALVGNILGFGLIIAIIPILEVATGGTLENFGTWTPLLLFGIFPLAGFFYGGIELIRRIIPNDIVGGDEEILKRMDSTVHIIYEVSGTAGALLARYWIGYFGFAFALFLLPIFFSIAAVFWFFVQLPAPVLAKKKKNADGESGEIDNNPKEETTFWQDLTSFFKSFFYSVYIGAKLVFGNRSLIWLIPAYTVPLVLHRYIENTLFPFYAKYVLLVPELSNILLAGSNLGELIGAALVLFLAAKIKTPLPWLRTDAFTLSLIWILAYAVPYDNVEVWAWCLFPAMSFLSLGWASGDVSLGAYVQARLARLDSKEKHTSPLGAVMSFLYVSYIILFPILAYGMGTVMDHYRLNGKPQEAFIYIGGVFLTIVGFTIFLSTFIPKGSFSLNPDPNSPDFDSDITFNGEVIKKLSDEELAQQSNDGNMVELVAGL